MAKLVAIEPGFYRIPLPETLSDSMHGEMTAFELNTVRVRDSDGQEGVGYTYTVGRNGGAVASVLGEIAEFMVGEDAEAIERLWHKGWWALHYGGRGGPTVLALSAFDIALWDLKAVRAGLPLWKLLGGYDPKVPVYAGGIDLDLPLDALLRQTDGNLGRGFRAIKMKVGRKNLHEDVERVRAMREHLGPAFPLMADANMKWGIDEAIRAARALQPYDLTWLEEPTIPDDPAGHTRIVREGGVPIATGENFRSLLGVQALHRERRRDLPGARRHKLRRRHVLHEGRAPGRGVQSAGHQPRRARRHRPPPGGLPQPLVPRGARLRARPLHRGAARDRGRVRTGAGSSGATESASTGRDSRR
jgi:L-alanine-DL-glutamate epimerase-like enolase superfamily enzyme